MSIVKPISAIIATVNRSSVLKKMLLTIEIQEIQPYEIIIVDASDNKDTFDLINSTSFQFSSKIIYLTAKVKGAATQREQGIRESTQSFILFMDDDVYLQPYCISKLWDAINLDDKTGGVNALIINQQFIPLGRISRLFYRLYANQETLNNLEGKTIGPCINFLCSENNDQSMISVDWLNTTTTLYRKSSLPIPTFPSYFKGYSFMEDAALSYLVSKSWKLYTIRDARIFHDSQPGNHKSNLSVLAEEEAVNRFFTMHLILNKRKTKDFLGFVALQMFNLLTSGNIFNYKVISGKLKAMNKIFNLLNEKK